MGNLPAFQKSSGIKKNISTREVDGRIIRVFGQKFVVSLCRKIRRLTDLCFRTILISEIVKDMKGAGITILRPIGFVSEYRNIS